MAVEKTEQSKHSATSKTYGKYGKLNKGQGCCLTGGQAPGEPKL